MGSSAKRRLPEWRLITAPLVVQPKRQEIGFEKRMIDFEAVVRNCFVKGEMQRPEG
jgi:hypothetical protein